MPIFCCYWTDQCTQPSTVPNLTSSLSFSTVAPIGKKQLSRQWRKILHGTQTAERAPASSSS
jgi:hypothetical protein